MRRSLVAVIAFLLTLSLPGTPEGAGSAAPKGAPWGADYFPNVPLVTQDGKTVRFYEDLLKDKKVLINLTYTHSENFGPLGTAKLAQVQTLLGSRGGRDIFMYTITLDPERDTPEALRSYAARFGAGPGWLFLTGTREAIDKVRYKLGERGRKEEHVNVVRVGDVARGQWMRLPLAGDPYFLYVEITKTLFPTWYAGRQVKSIAGAPPIEVTDPGEMLFMDRCATCHTVGAGEGIGPDLKGVTRRWAPAWLFRYLAGPAQMRARKDPLAVELANHYPVPMPSVGLNSEEVEELISFLEAQTTALEKKKRKTPAAEP